MKPPNANIPNEIFSLVISEFNKKSRTNSGPQMMRFRAITINPIIMNRTPIAVNQFLPRRRNSILMLISCIDGV